jgi:predicted O-methyltransferase YrrM
VRHLVALPEVLLGLVAAVIVGGVVSTGSGMVEAVLAGVATQAVVSLGAAVARLSRAEQAPQPVEGSTVVREVQQRDEGPPPYIRDLAEHLDRLVRDQADLHGQWRAATLATAEFRRGLVGELASTLADLQDQLRRGLAGVAEHIDASADAGRQPDPTPVDDDSTETGESQAYYRLLHEVRGIPRSLDLLHQFEAVVELRRRFFDVPAPLPLSGGWRTAPTTTLRYVDLIADHEPALVVECGSGVSSMWAGHALKAVGGNGRCVALEHDAAFREESVALVTRHGLDERVDVRLAPLRDRSEGTPWYDARSVEDLQDIDVLLVDGPPAATAPEARYPALEVLGPRMRTGGLILMDDTARPGEAAIVERWLSTGTVRMVDSSPDHKGWTLLEYTGGSGRVADRDS